MFQAYGAVQETYDGSHPTSILDHDDEIKPRMSREKVQITLAQIENPQPEPTFPTVNQAQHETSLVSLKKRSTETASSQTTLELKSSDSPKVLRKTNPVDDQRQLGQSDYLNHSIELLEQQQQMQNCLELDK